MENVTSFKNPNIEYSPATWIQESSSIDQVMISMWGLQGEVTNIPRTKRAYLYYYAELSEITKVAYPLIHKYNLTLLQLPSATFNKGNQGMWSHLGHKDSGQFLRFFSEMPIAQDSALDSGKKKIALSTTQQAGATITFLRKNIICSLLGIAQEDSDAQTSEQLEYSSTNNAENNNGNIQDIKKDPVTPKQLAILNKNCPLDSEKFRHICVRSKVNALAELSKKDATYYIGQLFKGEELTANLPAA